MELILTWATLRSATQQWTWTSKNLWTKPRPKQHLQPRNPRMQTENASANWASISTSVWMDLVTKRTRLAFTNISAMLIIGTFHGSHNACNKPWTISTRIANEVCTGGVPAPRATARAKPRPRKRMTSTNQWASNRKFARKKRKLCSRALCFPADHFGMFQAAKAHMTAKPSTKTMKKPEPNTLIMKCCLFPQIKLG